VNSARDPGFIRRLRAAVPGEVLEAEPLARYSTYRIGGPGTIVSPSSVEAVAAVLRLSAAAAVPVFPLGLGSNVLLPDEGLDALVLRFGKGLDQVVATEGTWRFGAGVPAPIAARKTAEAGWAGLHMMVGVPGSVGGGVYMNAGCHGGDWAQVTTRVVVVDRSGEIGERRREDIPFAYRRSGLGELVVAEAEVRLAPGDPRVLAEEIQRLFAWRQQSTPFNQPCCGSVFINPVWPAGPPAPTLRTAGQLIAASGLKGTRQGGAVVSDLHANYFVNTGGATAADVRRLMDRVREAVLARFGVELRPEVKVIGPGGNL
jgi:UDP-N-acetylmuramate dehydrogenase